MKSTQLTLSEPAEIHTFFRLYRCNPPFGWWFRGEADASWETSLLPKAGRPTHYLHDEGHIERFNYWTTQAVAFLSNLPKNDWERLAVAQHHGLATCLLDWTFNPLVATYFACHELPGADGAVYCYTPPAVVAEQQIPESIDARYNEIGFIPRAISSRILNQKAAFTIHIPPNSPMYTGDNERVNGDPILVKLVIPSNHKKDLVEMLNDYGINHVTLFPDLDGLSRQVNFETANRKGQTL